MTPLIVPVGILAEIREHARSMPPGFESTGRLVFGRRSGRAIRYHRLRNMSDQPGRVWFASSWRRSDAEFTLLAHSHPSGPATPSSLDVAFASSGPAFRRTFGIFATEYDELRIWRVDGKLVRPVAVVISKTG